MLVFKRALRTIQRGNTARSLFSKQQRWFSENSEETSINQTEIGFTVPELEEGVLYSIDIGHGFNALKLAKKKMDIFSFGLIGAGAGGLALSGSVFFPGLVLGLGSALLLGKSIPNSQLKSKTPLSPPSSLKSEKTQKTPNISLFPTSALNSGSRGLS